MVWRCIANDFGVFATIDLNRSSANNIGRNRFTISSKTS
jgi:hypothetical protein